MTVVFALLGSTALWLLYTWLVSAIIASYLSGRKGYGERPGLASGLLLNAIGVIIWLFVPAREDSLWKKIGPWGRGKAHVLRAAEPSATPAAGDGADAPPAT